METKRGPLFAPFNPGRHKLPHKDWAAEMAKLKDCSSSCKCNLFGKCAPGITSKDYPKNFTKPAPCSDTSTCATLWKTGVCVPLSVAKTIKWESGDAKAVNWTGVDKLAKDSKTDEKSLGVCTAFAEATSYAGKEKEYTLQESRKSSWAGYLARQHVCLTTEGCVLAQKYQHMDTMTKNGSVKFGMDNVSWGCDTEQNRCAVATLNRPIVYKPARWAKTSSSSRRLEERRSLAAGQRCVATEHSTWEVIKNHLGHVMQCCNGDNDLFIQGTFDVAATFKQVVKSGKIGKYGLGDVELSSDVSAYALPKGNYSVYAFGKSSTGKQSCMILEQNGRYSGVVPKKAAVGLTTCSFWSTSDCEIQTEPILINPVQGFLSANVLKMLWPTTRGDYKKGVDTTLVSGIKYHDYKKRDKLCTDSSYTWKDPSGDPGFPPVWFCIEKIEDSNKCEVPREADKSLGGGRCKDYTIAEVVQNTYVDPNKACRTDKLYNVVGNQACFHDSKDFPEQDGHQPSAWVEECRQYDAGSVPVAGLGVCRQLEKSKERTWQDPKLYYKGAERSETVTGCDLACEKDNFMDLLSAKDALSIQIQTWLTSNWQDFTGERAVHMKAPATSAKDFGWGNLAWGTFGTLIMDRQEEIKQELVRWWTKSAKQAVDEQPILLRHLTAAFIDSFVEEELPQTLGEELKVLGGAGGMLGGFAGSVILQAAGFFLSTLTGSSTDDVIKDLTNVVVQCSDWVVHQVQDMFVDLKSWMLKDKRSEMYDDLLNKFSAKDDAYPRINKHMHRMAKYTAIGYGGKGWQDYADEKNSYKHFKKDLEEFDSGLTSILHDLVGTLTGCIGSGLLCVSKQSGFEPDESVGAGFSPARAMYVAQQFQRALDVKQEIARASDHAQGYNEKGRRCMEGGALDPWMDLTDYAKDTVRDLSCMINGSKADGTYFSSACIGTEKSCTVGVRCLVDKFIRDGMQQISSHLYHIQFGDEAGDKTAFPRITIEVKSEEEADQFRDTIVNEVMKLYSPVFDTVYRRAKELSTLGAQKVCVRSYVVEFGARSQKKAIP